jgi:hypothetical protein
VENKRKNEHSQGKTGRRPYKSERSPEKNTGYKSSRRERAPKVKNYDLKNLKENQIVGVYAQGK